MTRRDALALLVSALPCTLAYLRASGDGEWQYCAEAIETTKPGDTWRTYRGGRPYLRWVPAGHAMEAEL